MIFVDTEFVDTGERTYLLSLGAVTDDGREFYAEAPLTQAILFAADPWVRANVLPKLTGKSESQTAMATRFAEFCGTRPREFWGYYAAHDWYLICQLYGGMMNVPDGWPHRINDIAQVAMMFGIDEERLPTINGADAHNALADARWTRDCYEFLLCHQHFMSMPLPRKTP